MDLTMRFFTSDTHFGHLRINELADRPFSSVEEADQTMVDRWNSVVRTCDVVYVLGDAALGQLELSLARYSQCNGYKVLVPGNHDRVFSGNKPEYVQRFWPLYTKYFSLIFPESVKFMLTSGTVVRLCHFPSQGDSQEFDRHVGHRPPADGLPVIHGHTHSKKRHTSPGAFHVGVDANDFTPVSEEEIEAWVETL
jgi:calcineurin-like phosphoesterase family protein